MLDKLSHNCPIFHESNNTIFGVKKCKYLIIGNNSYLALNDTSALLAVSEKI
jgi:hypothetical protein